MNFKNLQILLFSFCLLLLACHDDKVESPIENEDELVVYSSKINTWQTFELDEVQTGTFTFEFDMIPNKDNIDAVVGLSSELIVTDSSSLAALVRFDKSGNIDSYHDNIYEHHHEIKYSAGSQYHVRMEVDVFQRLYSVYVTDPYFNEFLIAKDFIFRNKSAYLSSMALIAGDAEIVDPGTHRVFNVELVSHKQRTEPSIDPINDVSMIQGTSRLIEIRAADPFGGLVDLEVHHLPEYATFEDLADGRGLLTLKTQIDCELCDLTEAKIEIVATNATASTEKIVQLNVQKNNELKGHVGDAEVLFGAFAHDPSDPREWRNDNQIIIGGGNNWIDPDNDIYDMAGVFPFEIPEMEAGQRFTFATLNVNVKEVSPWAVQDYDLYGLPFRTESSVLGTDYYQGEFGADTNSSTLQQRYANHQTAEDAALFTNEEGVHAIVNYLNTQLEAGAKSGDFVFFRFNVSVDDAETYGRLILWSSDEVDKGPRLLYALD